MLSTLFSEAAADAEVARNVAKYKRQKAMVKELNAMHMFKGANGKVFKVVSFEEVLRDDIEANIKKHEEALVKAKNALADYDSLTKPAATPPQTTDAGAVQPAPHQNSSTAVPPPQPPAATTAGPVLTSTPPTNSTAQESVQIQ